MIGEGKHLCPQHCNQDLLQHHFRNVRGANGDARNPPVAACASAARHGTVVRLARDKKSNSGSAPLALADVTQPLFRRGQSSSKRRLSAGGKEN